MISSLSGARTVYVNPRARHEIAGVLRQIGQVLIERHRARPGDPS